MSTARSLGAPAVATLAVAAATPVGGRLFAAAVTLLGVVALVEISLLLSDGGARPVLPAAAVGALSIPLLRLGGAAGWQQLPAVLAATVLGGFLLAVVSGRRQRITAVMGNTLLLALVVGAGTAGLIALRDAPDGFRWTAAVVALATVPIVVVLAIEHVTAVQVALVAGVVTMGAIAGVLVAVARPPFDVVTAILAAGLVGLALWAVGLLVLVATEQGRSLRSGAVLTGGLLVAATGVFVLASLLQS